MPLPSAFDIVLIDTLQVTANVGADCWGKHRVQPLHLSIHLHLQPTFLNKSGATDDVADSVHYGHLTKVVHKLVEAKAHTEDGGGFDGIDALVGDIAQAAFALAGEAASEVRVVVDAPKLVLLAGCFSVDTIIPRPLKLTSGSPSVSPRGKRVVTITNLDLPVLIGVNPPERLAKQRVVTDLVFYETDSGPVVPHTKYQGIVDELVKIIDASSYLTLEKFALELVRAACLSSTSLEAVTVRAQKPSALSFARYSGVQITRRRTELL